MLDRALQRTLPSVNAVTIGATGLVHTEAVKTSSDSNAVVVLAVWPGRASDDLESGL